MKIHCHEKDQNLIKAFISEWAQDEKYLALLFLDECDPIFFDGEPEELANCFAELKREGFVSSAKRIFQGDHFYRSDTGKCARCRRYRPEVQYDNENLTGCKHAQICDRCKVVTTMPQDAQKQDVT